MSILLDSDRDFDRFISNKPMDVYSRDVINEIKLFSTSVDGEMTSTPFGSYMYRLQKYPGDIDLVEDYYCCESAEQTIVKFEKSLKQIVRRIMNTRSHYYSETKVGIDKRFDFDVGQIHNGNFTPNKFLKLILKEYVELEIFSQTEYNVILNILKQPQNQDTYDVINNIIRDHRILRWEGYEILQGKKKLPGGVTLPLKLALTVDSLVKIDEITKIDNRFIEVTDIYFLSFGSPEENPEDREFINHMINELDIQIEKLYYSNMFYNPFKMVKRMFSLCRMKKVFPEFRAILKKLFLFVSSNTSLLYQIKSELDTIILLMNISRPPLKAIDEQIDHMKNRLATVLEYDNAQVKMLARMINDIVSSSSIPDKIILITKLSNEIKQKINYDTIQFLNDEELNPPPSILLPEFATYNRSIVRNRTSNPINPMKIIGSGLVIGAGCNCCKESTNEALASVLNDINKMKSV